MYEAIKKDDWKINIKKDEYFVEKMKNSSYIDYNDYSKWNSLTKIITNI